MGWLGSSEFGGGYKTVDYIESPSVARKDMI